MGEPCIGHRLFSRTEMGDGVGDVGGVPEHDRGDDEVEAGGTKLLRLGNSPGIRSLRQCARKLARSRMPLFDMPRYTRKSRGGLYYSRMWETWCAGEAPMVST